MRLLYIILLLPFALIGAQQNSESSFHITIASDTLFEKNPIIILENDKFIAVIRNCDRIIHRYGSTDLCIRDWLVKTSDSVYDGFCVSGNPKRKKINDARITYDGSERKEVIVRFGPRSDFMKRYTLLKDSAVVRVDYVKYQANRFASVNDDSSQYMPDKMKNVMHFFGAEEWGKASNKVKAEYLAASSQDSSTTCIDIEQADIVWNLYKGYLITIVGNLYSGTGFGKIMPNWNNMELTDLTNVYWDEGSSNYPNTSSREFKELLPLTGFVFVFNNGIAGAFDLSEAIVDKHLNETK
jgi:hypothetical protein